MKYCPRCNFTFADFHHVCDFDGAELISDPERLSSSSSRMRRFLKSPVLLAAAGLGAVVGSAFLIGYYDVVNQTSLPIRTEPSPTLTANSSPADFGQSGVSIQGPVSIPSKKFQPTKGANRASRIRVRLSSARISSLRKSPAVKGAAQPQVARRTAEQTHSQKEPILTAMLKTTWRVLKKPFKF